MSHQETVGTTVFGRVLYWITRLFCFWLFIITVLNVLILYNFHFFLVEAPEISTDIAQWGLIFQNMGQGNGGLWLFGSLAILSSVPYLLSGILFNKGLKWRVLALGMYILDSALVGFDLYAFIADGNIFGFILTLIVRGISFTLLILPLTSVRLRTVRPKQLTVSTDPTVGVVLIAPGLSPELDVDPHAAVEGVRRIALERGSGFVGFSEPLRVAVAAPGETPCEIGSLVNGQTVTVLLPVTACTLTLTLADRVTARIEVPAGTDGRKYTTTVTRDAGGERIDVV